MLEASAEESHKDRKAEPSCSLSPASNTMPPPAPPAIPSIYLTREQAADYITQRVGIPMTTTILANRASDGTGPAYRVWNGRGSGRGGRGRFAVYKPSDLDTWIEANLFEPTR